MAGPVVAGTVRGWVGSLAERVAASLFVVPAAFVLGGVALAAGALALDGRISDSPDLPFVLEPTVESSRAVLTTVASATITVAGIAFSIALLVVQLASSQYSPRVTHGLFRDGFNKRAMGVALGTFTYCLVVLQNVRGEDLGNDVLPASTALAVVFGIAAVATIVAFIDHNAHMMDVSEILAGVATETNARTSQTWTRSGGPGSGRGEPSDEPPELPGGQGFEVRSVTDGWIQTVEVDGLFDAVPDGGTVRVAAGAGTYTVTGAVLVVLWPVPEDRDRVRGEVLATFLVGDSRTMQQDVAFGVRQLADVALRALSPGVNDPTTAADALHHIVSVLRTMLCAEPPAAVLRGPGGRRVVRDRVDPADLIGLGFDEIRLAAAALPRVLIEILASLHQLAEAIGDRPEALAAIEAQAAAVLSTSATSPVGESDRRRVSDTYERLFRSAPAGTR